MIFQVSDLKENYFLELLNNEFNIIALSYIKGNSWIKQFSHLNSLYMSGIIHTGGESLQELAQRYINLYNNLGFSLYTTSSVCYIVVTSDEKKKSKMGMSTDQYITIKYQRLSSIRVIFIDYQTSKLQYKYQSYIIQEMLGVSVVQLLSS